MVTTDFSEPSHRATDVAARFAKQFHASLRVLHVYDEAPFGVPVDYPVGRERAGTFDFAGAAKASLATVRRERLADVEPLELDAVAHPSAIVAITDYAEEHAADLLIVGTHGRTGLSHMLVGSVAENVMRHAHCPVLAVRPTIEVAKFPRKMLVCTDFSEASEPALGVAAELAAAFDTEVTVLHVYNDAPPTLGAARRDYTRLGEVDAELRVALDKLHQKHFTKSVATELLVSTNPAGAITNYAHRSGADLIVLSTHGRTGVARLLMGSVAEKVTRHAPCPVLAVRSELAVSKGKAARSSAA